MCFLERFEPSEFSNQLANFVVVLLFLPIICGFLYWKILNKAMRFFMSYLIGINVCTIGIKLFIVFVSEPSFYNFVEPFLLKFKIVDTSFLQILYFINNTIFIGFTYHLILKKKLFQNALIWLTILVLLLELLFYFFIDGINKLGVFNPVLDSVYCFSLPSIYLFYLFKDEKNSLITPFKNPYFLISIGLFFTNILAFFFFAIQEKIFNTNPNLYYSLTILKGFIQIISIILYILAFKNHKIIRFLN